MVSRAEGSRAALRPARIEARVRELATGLKAGLARLPGAKHRIAAAPTGGVRFCLHIYNTMEEID